jgi:hypothetical protein
MPQPLESRQVPEVEVSHEGLVTATGAMIYAQGFNPTWELFSKTYGWFLLKKKISRQAQTEIERIWQEKDAEVNALLET